MSLENLNILVIEDHEDAARVLCQLITKRIPFANCRMAHLFYEGLDKAHAEKADLTLLDIHMPDADIDTVITSIPKFPKPVIVVTEMDDPENVLMEYCYAYGAENFYSKKNLLRIISTWDSEMTSRQLVSSIASAHFRNVMPERKHLFAGGVANQFAEEIAKLDRKLPQGVAALGARS